MTSPWPEPTDAELATLTIHICNWGSRSRVQQAICLAILRRHCYVPKIADYLGVSNLEVTTALRDLIGEGLLRDNQKLMLQ